MNARQSFEIAGELGRERRASGEEAIRKWQQKFDFVLWGFSTQSGRLQETGVRGANALLAQVAAGRQLVQAGKPSTMSALVWEELRNSLDDAEDLARRYIAAYNAQTSQSGGSSGSSGSSGSRDLTVGGAVDEESGPNWLLIGGGVVVVAGVSYLGWRLLRGRR